MRGSTGRIYTKEVLRDNYTGNSCVHGSKDRRFRSCTIDMDQQSLFEKGFKEKPHENGHANRCHDMIIQFRFYSSLGGIFHGFGILLC